MADKPVVTITGISGYLGAQVCLHFLESGKYKVRGTVRSKTNKAKIAPLEQAFKQYFKELELVEADLLDEQSLIKAIQGSTYVVHTASPFPLKVPKDEMELIKPAVDGTLAVMKGCHQAKVKRVVITSSIAAIDSLKKNNFTPDDWSDYEKDQPYQKSKHLAEKAAWDYVAALSAAEKFEVAVINPGFIIGPNLNSATFSSGDLIKKFMIGEFPRVPQLSVPCVDVRDCAVAHEKAISVQQAAGKRFILNENTRTMNELAQGLHKGYAQYGYPIPIKPMPYFLIWIASFFDGEAANIIQYWGRTSTFDNTTTKTILGVKFTPFEKSLNDMAVALIETGYVPDYKSNPKHASSGFMTKMLLFGATVAAISYGLNTQYKWVEI